MSKKWVYEELLTRIEKLEAKVRLLLFLQDHDKDEILVGAKVSDAGLIDSYAQFVNADSEVVEIPIVSGIERDNFDKFDIKVKTYLNKPFQYIEVRQGGLLDKVFKVDRFLSKLWAQDMGLYMDAYNVEYNLGGKNGSKRGTREVDA